MRTRESTVPAGGLRQWTERVDAALFERLAARVSVASGGETLDVEAPATGEVLGAVPLGAAHDVQLAAACAREAQATWARWTPAQRAPVFLRFHDLVIARSKEVLDLIQLESGKARKHAFEEILDVAIQARYYAHVAEKLLAPRRRQGALPLLTAAWEYRRPKGVAGFITPWNYPFAMGISDAIPALLAGNGVLLKPASLTPYSALWAAAALEEAGVPTGLVQVVTGRGGDVGDALVDNVDFVMFTGSTSTGRSVALRAAARLIDYSMELGGKNAMIVLDDADLKRAVPGAVRAIFSNCGQLCIHTERLYVQEGIHDRFVDELIETVRGLRVGASMAFDKDVGSLSGADQLATVQEHVADAVAKGARVLVGGQPRPELGPYFYEPTLLTDVPDNALLAREETFGPVASIYKVESEEQALHAANDSDLGLNFCLWTRDTKRGRELAARLQAGTVNINEAYAATWASASPMGGFKQSGVGRRHGAAGLLKYTEAQTVAVQRLLAIDTPSFATDAQYAAVMRLAIKALRYVPGYK
jgi:succinate-semialdehyde dehydrogenase / glutarate-semialdehyde dehydrogenase